MSIKDDAITIGVVGLIVYIGYQAIKGGLFGKGVSDVLTGEVGAKAGAEYYGKNLTPGYDVSDYSTYDTRYASGSQTRADVVYNVPTLNVSATDAALSNIGLTTAQMEYINNNYGFAVGNSIVSKIGSGNTGSLTATELAALKIVGWSGYAAGTYVSETTFDDRMNLLNTHGAR